MKIKGAEIEEKDKKLFHDLLPILLVFSFGGVFGFIYEELFTKIMIQCGDKFKLDEDTEWFFKH